MSLTFLRFRRSASIRWHPWILPLSRVLTDPLLPLIRQARSMGAASGSAHRRRSRLSQSELQQLLSPTATTGERIQGLLGLGLHLDDISTALGGTSTSTMRNWVAGATEARANAAIALDDLRATAKALLDAGLEPRRVANWLISRNEKFEGQRPIDVLPANPSAVLSAAFERVLENPSVSL